METQEGMNPPVTLNSTILKCLEVLNWVHLPSLLRGAFFDCTEWSRDPVSNGSCNETTSWKPMEFLAARLLLGYDRKLKIVYVASFTEPIISDEMPSQKGRSIVVAICCKGLCLKVSKKEPPQTSLLGFKMMAK